MKTRRLEKVTGIQERILLAAREEFGVKGVAGAQVEAIARQAGVTKQVVYYHFGSKTDLYDAMSQHLTECFLRELRAVDFQTPDPVSALELFFSTIFDVYVRIPHMASLSLDWSFRSADQIRHSRVGKGVVLLFEAVLRRATAAGRVEADMDGNTCFSFAMMIICASFLDCHDPAKPGLQAAVAGQRKARALAAIKTVIGVRDAPTQAAAPVGALSS